MAQHDARVFDLFGYPRFAELQWLSTGRKGAGRAPTGTSTPVKHAKTPNRPIHRVFRELTPPVPTCKARNTATEEING